MKFFDRKEEIAIGRKTRGGNEIKMLESVHLFNDYDIEVKGLDMQDM